MNELNLLAVLLAALSSFLVGGLWYSPVLFGRAWNLESGRDPKGEAGGHPARVFGLSFLFSLVAALAFAWWLGPAPPLGHALSHGLVAGAALVAASFGINYQFANRSFTLWLIDGGYHTVQFVLFALVLGSWH
jgi:hypothetical protein